jgi:hypothetical protein
MPPKGGRILQERNFAQTVIGEATAPENRQVLTAVGLFVVGLASEFLVLFEMDRTWHSSLGLARCALGHL